MTRTKKQLLIATGNRGKVRELEALLKAAPYELLSLADIGDVREVAETGTAFYENAVLKARGYADQTGHLTLADDSGLEVAALDNRPGVHSARFGGEGSSYPEKMAALLAELKTTGSDDRSARFVCSMVVAEPGGNIVASSEGVCSGTIAETPSGTGGFGYDPVFIPNGYDKTFAELPEAVKQALSHRAGAAEGIIRYLLGFSAV